MAGRFAAGADGEVPADTGGAELAEPETEPAEPEAAGPGAAADGVDGALEEDDALSVRPAPQAAMETASVRAAAAAKNRRDVVLRMEPLSAALGSGTGWGASGQRTMARVRR